LKLAINKGLTDRVMMGGLPRNITILGGTVAAALILGLQNLWLSLIAVPVYIALQLLYRKDPYFLEILLRHINDDDFLEG
jgi:type IV secretion system protein VirB3